jgi:hypothetical protein
MLPIKNTLMAAAVSNSPPAKKIKNVRISVDPSMRWCSRSRARLAVCAWCRRFVYTGRAITPPMARALPPRIEHGRNLLNQ